MCNAQFYRTDMFGNVNGGGYSSTLGENDIIQSIDFALESGDKNTLKLKISRPQYYLLGEYNLEIR